MVIGVSAGGLAALAELFAHLPASFPLPLITVQHVHATQKGSWLGHFNARCPLAVQEAGDKERIRPGHIYLAPPGYHLLVERDETLALAVDAKVNYARPSIDVLFESAAYVWSLDLIGIILTGANHDGAHGLRVIQEYGGLTIAQDPASAEYPVMPQAAIAAGGVDRILPLNKIGGFLSSLSAPR